MTATADGVLAALRAAGVACSGPRGAEHDICRYDLGEPVAYARPKDTGQVAAVVRVAREARTLVVPVGRRTGYWHPLDLRAAVVVETAALTGILEHDLASGWVRVGAGTPVRELDDWLRTHGAILAVHPDAFGDTAVGAAVAMDLAAGVGMGRAIMRDIVLGLRVVSGAGEVISTGAALAMGKAPFMRAGLPDPTELFCASEGALGIITEVVVRVWPRPAMACLTWQAHHGVAPLLAFARTLRQPGLVDTYRADHTVTRDDPEPPWRHTLVLESARSVSELAERTVEVEADVRAAFGDPDVSVVIEDPAGPARFDRWLGPPGAHAGIKRRAHFAGVDVLVPWGSIEAACGVADEVRADASGLAFMELRHALYFSWHCVNLGLHMNFAAPPGERSEGVVDMVGRAQARLAELDIAPYRWGRQWHHVMQAGLDPGYVALMGAVKRTLDPDGLLHPGVSLFE